MGIGIHSCHLFTFSFCILHHVGETGSRLQQYDMRLFCLSTQCLVECKIRPCAAVQWSVTMLITSRLTGLSCEWLTLSRHSVDQR